MLSVILLLCVSNLQRVEYLANVHFGDIRHSFIPHFTLHSAEKILHQIFSRLPLDNFLHSVFRKIPLAGP